MAALEQFPVGLEACDCVTPLGDARATRDALLAGRRALTLHPVRGSDGGDAVPLALCGPMDETLPPRWLPPVRSLAARIPPGAWGSAREPVLVTSSNFGVGSLHAYTRDRNPGHMRHGTPFATVEFLRRELGWGTCVHPYSHACVTAHLGLAHAARLLHAGLADRVLVFSFDFISPFVAAGFHALKILNGVFPAPFAARETGSIGLGDGAAFAVLARGSGRHVIEAHTLHNEMHHFTANRADGAGFAAVLAPFTPLLRDRRIWVKGHGTGTLEAGRLEAEAVAREFAAAPLVSWKGGLGHTLGSCGLVELAVAAAAIDGGVIPGTIGTEEPCFSPQVSRAAFGAADFDCALLTANAFGGAHAALLLRHG